MEKNPPDYEHLGPGGRALWDGIAENHELDAQQVAQLIEACRCKDRLDEYDELLRGAAHYWVSIVFKDQDGFDGNIELVIDKVADKANQTANTMKMLLAALRLPDAATGKRPAYSAPLNRAPKVPGGTPKPVTALERARAARQAVS